MAYGYVAGGYVTSIQNTIDRFQFAASADATDVGDISPPISHAAGSYSGTHGYMLGGLSTYPSTSTNDIQKWSFASSASGSSCGTITNSSFWVWGYSKLDPCI